MTEKILGKIDFAEYGFVWDYPFLIGLQLGFKLADKTSIMSGGQYLVNISEECRWKTESERQIVITKTVDDLHKILKDAKCCYVSELIGKPVEVEIEKNTFKDFRILTEVL